jgi:outer membrane receptor protein involved in Fe transport
VRLNHTGPITEWNSVRTFLIANLLTGPDTAQNNMNIQKIIVAFIVLFQAVATHASSGGNIDHFLSLSLEELMAFQISISTDTKKTIAKAPAVVSAITAADIKATGATNLVEMLETIPGIHPRTTGFGYRPQVGIRGANDKQTLLMINGTPIRDLMWTFGIFWKGLPTSIIERVEIIRGPGSALFGADASAGVINVITKTAGKIEHSEVGVRIGSFNTNTAWMQHGGNWNGFDIGLTADLFGTDGHNPFIEADKLGTADHAQTGWHNMDLRFSVAKDHWRLQADYMRHSDLETSLTGDNTLDSVTSAKNSRFNLGLFYNNENFRKDWGLDAELRYQHLDYTSGDGFQEKPPGYTDGADTYPDGQINRMRSAERRVDLEVSGLFTGIDDHSLRMGTGYTWQDLYFVEQLVNFGTGPDGNTLPAGGPLVDLSDTPYAFAPEDTRKIWHLFLQDIWTISDDWELTAGARYDHYSDFGGTLNPRLALVWHSTDKLTTKMMYGQGFRAPNYQELFAETSRSLPNSSLKPERSKTLEVAFFYKAASNLNLGLNIYRFTQTDIINLVTVTGLSKRQYQNTGEHTIRGIELEAQWQATEDLRVSGNYTHREPDDNGFRTAQQPDEDAYLRADWRFLPGWNWNVQANWIGKRARKSGDSRPPVDDYAVTDSTVRYMSAKNWEFSGSVRNLFDEDAREYAGQSMPNDLPMPERSFYAEARYKF